MPIIVESPCFYKENEQAHSSLERGYAPNESLQERGEEEDKVYTPLPPKTTMRKKNFREISVTDM